MWPREVKDGVRPTPGLILMISWIKILFFPILFWLLFSKEISKAADYVYEMGMDWLLLINVVLQGYFMHTVSIREESNIKKTFHNSMDFASEAILIINKSQRGIYMCLNNILFYYKESMSSKVDIFKNIKCSI